MQIQLPEKVNWIIDNLKQRGFDAYAVGGCVRDSLLGRIPDDWDITTSAKPMQIKEIFNHTVDTGLQHGTVTVLVDHEGFEVTTYRIDGEYEDNRHPKEVIFTDNLIEDLKRRDFTINAMAYNKESGLVDVFEGKEDLQAKVIRCVGDPLERFDEDALRVLRAVRFAAQLDFTIDKQTMSAMKKFAPNLSTISAERIQVELMKLLASAHPEKLLTAYEIGITAIVLPEFDRMMKTRQNNPHHIYNVGEHTLVAVCSIKQDKILRLTMLLHDVGKPDTEEIDEEGISHFYQHAAVGEKIAGTIIRRLKMDNETLHKVKRLVKWHDYRFTVDEKNIRKAVNKIGPDIFTDLLLVMHADVKAQSSYLQKEKLDQLDEIKELYQKIIQEEQCISLKQLALDGNDLIQLGIPKGKQVGEVLSRLLEYVLDEPSRNERSILIKKVHDIQAKQKDLL